MKLEFRYASARALDSLTSGSCRRVRICVDDITSDMWIEKCARNVMADKE